jgi:hypothetical protein
MPGIGEFDPVDPGRCHMRRARDQARNIKEDHAALAIAV